MEENNSRAELQHELTSLEERIEQLKKEAEVQGTPISIATLIGLEDKVEEVKNRLKELNKHEDEKEDNKKKTSQDKTSENTSVAGNEKESEDIKAEEQARDGGTKQQSKEKTVDERQSSKVILDGEKSESEREDCERTEENCEVEEEVQVVDGETKRTLHDWERISGTHLLADKYALNKYDKYLSENDFRNIIATENDAVIITDGGLNENFFRDSTDKSSKSAIRNAIRDGNMPTHNTGGNYINVANGGGMDGRVYDNDGDGTLDTDDLRNDRLSEKGIDVKDLKNSLTKTISGVTSSEVASVGNTLDRHSKDPEEAKRALEANEMEKDDDDEFAPTPPKIV